MKLFIRILSFLLIASAAHAQSLRVSLNVTPHPNPNLSEWAARRETAILTVTNLTSNPVDVKFDVRISLNGTLVAQTKLNQIPSVTAQPGVNVYYADQIIPFSDVKIYGDNEQRAAQTGMLPSGTYSFCVTLVDPLNTQKALSPEVCKSFTLTSYQLPVLILPANTSDIPVNTRFTFRWTPVSPKPPFAVRYVLRLMEVLEGQTPVQAFRVNRPILETELVNTTQLLYPSDHSLPEAGKRFVWSVQTLDNTNGQPIGDQPGYAEPFSFRVIETGGKKSGGVTDNGDLKLKQDSTGGDQVGGKKKGSGDSNAKIGGTDTTDSSGNLKQGSGGNNERRANSNSSTTPDNPNAGSCGNCGTPVVIADTAVAGNTLAKDDSVMIGRFAMKLGDLSDGSAGNLSGKGEIYVPWLLARIAVEFQGLKVNAVKRVISGDVIAKVDSSAPQYPQQWAINNAVAWSWVKKQVSSVDSWLKQKGNIVNQVNGLAKPIELPLGFNNISGYTIAVSEMRFTKDTAYAAAVADVPVPKEDDTLSFGLSSVPICPQGLAHRATLDVLSDITLRGLTPNQITFTMTLKARTSQRQGTYIAWGCGNFDTLAIDLDIAFPRAWMVPRPDPDSTKQVIATLTGKAIKWKDWMIAGSLPAATFVGTNGLGMKIDSMTYDHSDLENPLSLVFPPTYDSNATKGLDFNGFWAKEITIYFPDGWRTFSNPNDVPTASAKNMIINKDGLTADFIAANVIQYPNADLNRLSGSVDTLKASFVNSQLTQAYMRGKITLPVSDTTVQNALIYKALWNNVQKQFDFSMSPKDSITTKLFAGAKLKLLGTSSLTMKIKKGERKFALNLNGEVGWSDKEISIGAKKIKLDLAPDFENVGIAYDDSTKQMTFSKGAWSFASPQKKIAKFPITVDSIDFKQVPAAPGELVHAMLKFDVIVSLDSNRIGGSGSFSVEGAVKKSTGDSKFRFKPEFIDFNVSKIRVFANLPAVKIDGSIDFYNSDPKWGDGFAAAIKATFNSVQLEVSANARFGSVVDNASNTRYRYWYVEAKAILPPPGISFLPGYAFYGFGAAAWKRVNVDMTGAQPNATTVSNATSTSSATSSGAVMTPDKNIGFGFKALAVLGTTPDPQKMNADVAVLGQFTNSGGMSKLGIQGNIWLMAKLTERPTAPVQGSINITYDFTTKIFDLNASVTVNKPPVTGNGTLKVHVEGKTGIWYVKLGDPVNRCVLAVDMLGTQISSNSYFMFGKNIQPPSGFTQRTVNGLQSVSASLNPPSASSTTQAMAGNGFAAGLEIGFDTGERYKNLFGRVNLKYRAAAGFEVNLSLLKYPGGTTCNGGSQLVGMNGWYVQGNVALYAIATCGIHIDMKDGTVKDPCLVCCKKNHPNGCDINIASVKVGGYFLAGFPKSSWAEGQAAGSFSVLEGAFSGSFSADISIGEKCTPTPPAAVTTSAQDVAADQANKLISSIEPSNNAYNFPVTEPVTVIYAFTPNESFELVEQTGGASGDMITRTFQARYSVTIEQKVGANWVAKTHVSQKDALGAYLFRLKSQAVFNGNNINANAKVANNQPVKGGNANPGPNVSPILNPNAPVKGNNTPSPNPPKPTPVNNAPNQPKNNMMNDAPPPPTENDNYSFDNTAAQAFMNSSANWDSSATYRVTVTGTLWEYKNGSWAVAKRKSNNTDVKQTEVHQFNTPAPPLVVNNNVNINKQN